MNEKSEDESYCRYCHCTVQTYTFYTECVGQYGKNIILHENCSICNEQIKEILVDKDI